MMTQGSSSKLQRLGRDRRISAVSFMADEAAKSVGDGRLKDHTQHLAVIS